MNEYDKELFNDVVKQKLFGKTNSQPTSLDISFSKCHRRDTIRDFKEIYNILWKHPEKIDTSDERFHLVNQFISLERKHTQSTDISLVSLDEDRVIVRKKKKRPIDMRNFVSKQIINVREH